MLDKHKKIERNAFWLMVVATLVVTVGGLVEIVPLFRIETTIEQVKGVRPYTPLELAGQRIYMREGCYNCHSQQIRPLRDEVERYGHYSLAAESMYDHPFQWGSKRTGPDLARVGGKYSDEWQTAHLIHPQDVVPESIMPGYGFMMNRGLDMKKLKRIMAAMQTVGVPYTDEMLTNAVEDLQAQANPELDGSALAARYGAKVVQHDFDGQKDFLSEMDALVAYLQALGTLAELKDYELAGEKP